MVKATLKRPDESSPARNNFIRAVVWKSEKAADARTAFGDSANSLKFYATAIILNPRPGAKHCTKRLGQGESSGCGKTAGRGGKGQDGAFRQLHPHRLRRRTDAAHSAYPQTRLQQCAVHDEI